MQIFFVTERHHWIATALRITLSALVIFMDRIVAVRVLHQVHRRLTSRLAEEIFLFDSCFQKELEPSAELQIAQMYKPLIAHNGLLLSVASIQQQSSGSNNCGLFAIAAAYHALQGDNLDHIILNEDKMRNHLIRCFEKSMRN